MANDLVMANSSCVMDVNGKRVSIRRGVTTASADHPIVQAHPELFSPLRVDFPSEEPVKVAAKVTEAATAGPDERRSVRPNLPRKTTK